MLAIGIRRRRADAKLSRRAQTVKRHQDTLTCRCTRYLCDSFMCQTSAFRSAPLILRRRIRSSFPQLEVRQCPLRHRVLCKAKGCVRQSSRLATNLVLHVAIQVFGVRPLPQVWLPARRACRHRIPERQRSDVPFPTSQAIASAAKRPDLEGAVPGPLLSRSLSIFVRLEAISARLQGTLQQSEQSGSRRCSQAPRAN